MEASKPGRILLIDDDPALGGYLTGELIASTARYWSRYCGGSHAEPFEAIRDRTDRSVVTP